MTNREPPAGYLTREQAVALLGIKKESFYSYVSRFHIRALSRKGEKRKFYNRVDVERLISRSQSKFGKEARASHAMRFGEPIVQTSICEITPDGPRYRGHNAIDLVRQNWRFESVADLLMEGGGVNRSRPWSIQKGGLPSAGIAGLSHDPNADRVSLWLVSLIMADATEGGGRRTELNDFAKTRQLIQRATELAGLLGPGRSLYRPARKEWIAEAILRGFGCDVSKLSVHAVNAALIMSAEHELAPPTVAVRVAASTGANISSCLIAGIVTESGRLQGGGIETAEDVMYRIMEGKRRTISVGWFEDQARRFPWFSHPLYSKDPRATLLIELARSVEKNAHRSTFWKFVDKIESGNSLSPGVGFSLVILAIALGLPKRGALLIRLIGRMSGWAAHAGEQRKAGFMMRPRAKFV